MTMLELIGYPLLPVAALELLLGFLLLRQNPRSSAVNKSVAAIAFFSAAFSFNTAVMYLLASRGLDHTLFVRMNWIGWFTIPAALQFVFFMRSEESRAARVIGYVLYPYWTLLLVFCIFTDLIVTDRYQLLPFLNDPGPIEVPARIGGAAMIIWLIVEMVRTRQRLSGAKKIQLNYFFLGSMIFALGGAVISGVLQVVEGVRLEPGLGSYFSLPWVLLTFYAIARYSLFEARIIVSRTLSVLILLLTFSAAQVGLLAMLEPVLGRELSVLVSLSLIGFFFFGTPVSKAVQSMVNSLVIGDRYGYAALLRESVMALNVRKHASELAEYILKTLREGLGVEDAGVYLRSVEGSQIMRCGIGRFSLMTDSRALADMVVQRMMASGRSVIRRTLGNGKKDPDVNVLATYLRGIGAEVIVPLLFQERLQGALVLGAKRGGEPYGQTDIALLETLAVNAAVALENARLNDLTRQVRASLEESEGRFRMLTQTIPAGIIIYQGAVIVYANEAAAFLTGYGQEELRNMTIQQLIRPGQPEDIFGAGPDAAAGRSAGGRELSIVTREGEERWVIMMKGAIEYASQPAVIWTFVDSTELKRAEGRVRYERMRNAMRKMAVVVRDDLRGIMRDVREAGNVLQEALGDDHPMRSQAARILRASQRAEILSRGLEDLSSRQRTRLERRELNAMVERMLPVLNVILTRESSLQYIPADGPLMVRADDKKIELVLMNLVAHAREAMPAGNTVSITIGAAEIDAEFIRRHGYGKIGRYAMCAVHHKAAGREELHGAGIYELFFPEKGDWGEAGLGLSLVYDIVKDHSGYVTISGGIDRGSSVTIYLPLLA